jgi:hypothetical protein
MQATDTTLTIDSGALPLADAVGVSHVGTLTMTAASGALAGVGQLRARDSVSLVGTISGSLSTSRRAARTTVVTTGRARPSTPATTSACCATR